MAAYFFCSSTRRMLVNADDLIEATKRLVSEATPATSFPKEITPKDLGEVLARLEIERIERDGEVVVELK